MQAGIWLRASVAIYNRALAHADVYIGTSCYIVYRRLQNLRRAAVVGTYRSAYYNNIIMHNMHIGAHEEVPLRICNIQYRINGKGSGSAS